jgi:hypothetical protein
MGKSKQTVGKYQRSGRMIDKALIILINMVVTVELFGFLLPLARYETSRNQTFC